MHKKRVAQLFSFALGLLIAATTHAQTSPPRFITAKSFPVGLCCVSDIYDIAGGDVDGDGKPDLVVSLDFETNSPAPYLKWYKGNGDGTFTSETISNAQDNVPQYVRLADVNGDGILDIITTANGMPRVGNDSTAAELDVYIGNGNGTFKDAHRYVQNVAVSTPVVADLTGHGKPDLAVHTPNGIQILTNNGDGTFSLGQIVPGFFSVLGAADFNHDGKIDLLAGSQAGLTVLIGNGNGTVTVGPSTSLSNSLNSSTHPLAIVDVNRDGRPDIIAALPDRAEVLLGNGDGTFRGTGNLQSPLIYPAHYVYWGPYSITEGDFNHDGNADFAVGPYEYFGQGDGSFKIAKFYSVTGPVEIALDVNGDSNPDLVWAVNSAFFGTSLNVALGTPAGLFVAPFETVAPAGGASQPLVTADFNRDGIMDVAVQCSSNNNTNSGICVFPGSGHGYFNTATAYSASFNGGLAVGDVNGDGFLDLVATSQTPGSGGYDVTVLLGKGNGTFAAARTQLALNTSSFAPNTYLLDVNKDHKLDLVGPWGVALGNGDGTFKTAIPLPSNLTGIHSLVWGDFDHDGFIDLAMLASTVSDPDHVQVHVLLGDGSGTFPTDKSFADPNLFDGLAVADVNKDGKQDLLYTSITPQFDTGLSVILGKGDGTFGAPAAYPFSSYYCCENGAAVLTGDFDRDGNTDAIVTTYDHVEYLRGLGNGKFAPAEEYLLNQNSAVPSSLPAQYGILDINGDGFLDLAVTDGFFGITRLINTGKPASSAP